MVLNPTAASRWDWAGTVVIGGHNMFTKSTTYLVWMLHWSPEQHVSDGPTTHMCKSHARTVRHSTGMVGGQSSVSLYILCELNSGAQGIVLYHFLRHAPQLQGRFDRPENENKIFYSFRSR